MSVPALSSYQIHQALSFIGVNSLSINIDNANISVYQALVEEYYKLLQSHGKKSQQIVALQRALKASVERRECEEMKAKALKNEIALLKSLKKLSIADGTKSSFSNGSSFDKFVVSHFL